jgi:predicted GNAT family acetyltransferase
MTNLHSENPENTINKKLLKEGIKATLMKEEIETAINNKLKTIPVGAQ